MGQVLEGHVHLLRSRVGWPRLEHESFRIAGTVKAEVAAAAMEELPHGARQAKDSPLAEVQMPADSPKWKLGYFSTISILLIVVAVLPCLSFFKVAWDFEQRLFIESSQLRLANDINNRTEGVQTQYLDVGLAPDVRQQILAEPVGENGYFSYHNSFFSTQIDSAPKMTQKNATCGWESACYQQSLMESALSMISPLYNEIKTTR